MQWRDAERNCMVAGGERARLEVATSKDARLARSVKSAQGANTKSASTLCAAATSLANTPYTSSDRTNGSSSSIGPRRDVFAPGAVAAVRFRRADAPPLCDARSAGTEIELLALTLRPTQ